jgi:hypothetical protein
VTKLKLSTIPGDRPVTIAIELPAAVDRDLEQSTCPRLTSRR